LLKARAHDLQGQPNSDAEIDLNVIRQRDGVHDAWLRALAPVAPPPLAPPRPYINSVRLNVRRPAPFRRLLILDRVRHEHPQVTAGSSAGTLAGRGREAADSGWILTSGRCIHKSVELKY
jgi:hypothetical protein